MRIKRSLLVAFVMLVLPALAAAQDEQPRGLLDEAEAHIAAGEFPEARSLLERWRSGNPNAPRSDHEQQARYHFLTARLTTNVDSAEDNYLTVAVNYPTSRYAPDALLRLAQARHVRGDTQQAIAYLERLLSDYPASDQRAMAAIWLARVQSGRTAANASLCSRLRSADPGTNPETIEHLKNETARVCGAAAVASKPVAKAETAAPKPSNKRAKADTTAGVTATPARIAARDTTAAPVTASAGRLSIQVGAFRELSGARTVKAELERNGFTDVRMVRVPGNNLIRVRIGRFVNRAAAAATLARLASSDISAVLVTDTQSEEVVRN